MKYSNNFLSKAYVFTALLFFIGLVFSKLILSISEFIFVGLLLLEGNFKEKFIKLKQDTPALIFISIYIFFFIGLLWTSNFDYAFHDLKIKLPLLLLPIVFVCTEKISKKEIEIILFLFVVVIFAKTVESSLIIFDHRIPNTINNVSHKISHIRYSLFLVFAFFSSFYLYKNIFKKKYQRIILILISIWFIFFIFILQSFTAIIILIILTFGSIVYFILKKKDKKIIFFSSIIFSIFTILFIFYINKEIQGFTKQHIAYNHQFTKLTLNNNLYNNDTSNILIENGYKVGLYQCDKELKKEWNIRSKIDFDSNDLSGYKIKLTLKRYLTSLGYTKDSLGISKLDNSDILNIEKGYTNYKYTNPLNISGRIYKIIWQFYFFSKTKNANDQSITQRIEYLKTAFHIIKKNIFIGVGTGDVPDSFAKQYIIDKTNLRIENRLRSHNQIITNILTLGLFIGLWITIAFILPFFINNLYKQYLPTIFFILVFLSMFTDDIYETSISVSFVSFFFSLLILKNNNK